MDWIKLNLWKIILPLQQMEFQVIYVWLPSPAPRFLDQEWVHPKFWDQNLLRNLTSSSLGMIDIIRSPV